MKVALFGGTGFVGSYLTEELLNNKHKPVLLVRSGSENKITNLSNDKKHNWISYPFYHYKLYLL